MKQNPVTFEIASRLEAIPMIGESVNRLCTQAGLPAPEPAMVELCIVEALTNVIKHAYHPDSDGKITLAVRTTSNSITFDMFDNGRPAEENAFQMDRRQILEEQHAFADLPESGRGIAIMQSVMDSLEYIVHQDCNQLRLVKRLPGNLPAVH